MRIKLERTLASCPHEMSCIVCNQKFRTPKIRALLYGDASLLQGDVCPDCLRLKATIFHQKLQEQADRLILKSMAYPAQSDALYEQAIELFATAEEPIQYPTIFHWVLKKIAIFAEESQELEAARFGTAKCGCDGGFGHPYPDVPQARILFTDPESKESL